MAAGWLADLQGNNRSRHSPVSRSHGNLSSNITRWDFFIGFQSPTRRKSPKFLTWPLELTPETSLLELIFQRARTTDDGSLLTQVMGMPPDHRTSETYIAVNNIFRYRLSTPGAYEIANLSAWMDPFTRQPEIASITC